MGRGCKGELQGRRWHFVRPLLATCATLTALFAIAATLRAPGGGATPLPAVRVALNPAASATTPGAAGGEAPVADAEGHAPATQAPTPEVPAETTTAASATAAGDPSATAPAQAGVSGGSAAAGGNSGSPSFMGVALDCRRVVIAFDVADSVRRKALRGGVPLERIRDEAAALLGRLDERWAFTLIQFVRRYDAFSPTLLQATAPNRTAAAGWLSKSFRSDGRSGGDWTTGEPDGIQLVLKVALDMRPELLVIISDGDFQRSVGRGGRDVDWREIEEQVARWQLQQGRSVRIHFIGIAMEPAQKEAAASFVQRFGGQLRLIDTVSPTR